MSLVVCNTTSNQSLGYT